MKSEYFINKEIFRKNFITLLEENYVTYFEDTTIEQRYGVLYDLVKRSVSYNWKKSKETKGNTLYYFTKEVNSGNYLHKLLINLDVKNVVQQVCLDLDIDIFEILNIKNQIETNFNLVDALTNLNYKVTTFSLESEVENPKLKRSTEKINVYGEIKYSLEESLKCEHINYDEIDVVSYETFVCGYKNDFVNTIVRWDCNCVGVVSDYAYIASSLKMILKNKEDYKIVFNDESSLIILEYIRVLLDDYNYSWDNALKQISDTFVYEQKGTFYYNKNKFKNALPRLYDILEEVHKRSDANIISSCIDMSLLSKTLVANKINVTNFDYKRICFDYNNEMLNILNDYCTNWDEDCMQIVNLNKDINKRKLQKRFRDMRIEGKKSFYNNVLHKFDDGKKLTIKIDDSILSILYVYYTYEKLKNDVQFKNEFTPITFVIDFSNQSLLNLNNDIETSNFLNVEFIDKTNVIYDCFDLVDNNKPEYLFNGVQGIKQNMFQNEFHYHYLLEKYNLSYDEELVYFNSYNENMMKMNELYKDEVLWCKQMIENTISSVQYISDKVVNDYNEKYFNLSKVKILW